MLIVQARGCGLNTINENNTETDGTADQNNPEASNNGVPTHEYNSQISFMF